MLRSIDLWCDTDVSGEHIGPIFNGQAIQKKDIIVSVVRKVPRHEKDKYGGIAVRIFNLDARKTWVGKSAHRQLYPQG